MLSVKAGTIYVPKFSELQLRPCPDPPSKLEIKNFVVDACARHKAGYINRPLNPGFTKDSKTVPDKNFLLAILSTLEP